MTSRTRTMAVAAYWAGAVAMTIVAAIATVYAPTERSMGIIQKVFYLHLPAAIATALACFVTFVASIGFLARRQMWWDDLAAASARIAVQLCTVVLVTGMIWGKVAWGHWWTWSPRLVFVLILWLLYVVYLVVRSSVESAERRAMVSAAYGLIAFLDVPLVWLSVQLLPDIHPISVTLASSMRLAQGSWFVAVGLIAAGLVVGQFQANRRDRLRQAEAFGDDATETGTLHYSAGGL